MSGEFVKAGYLVKSPPQFKPLSQWQKRWFILLDSKLVYPLSARYVRLEYYQSHQYAEKLANPKGVINMNSCTQVISREPIKGHEHVFDVHTKERVYHLVAESGNDKQDWVDTLNAHAQLFTEQDLSSVRILPRNWTVFTDTEAKKPVYQNKTRTNDTLSTPPGYPLYQTFAHPDVTFYDEPQKKEFTSSGGHADFNNGVEVTVRANAFPPGTSVGIKVQPSLAPKDVFVMPEGIQSASPSYLISSEGLDGEVTLTMEHHIRVSTQQEANDLLFLQADLFPKRSGSKIVYVYREVPEGKSEFTPGGNKGRLTLVTRLKNFFKVGQRKRGATDSNLYTVRVYRSPPQTTGDRIVIIGVCLFGSLYTKFLETLDNVLIPRDYPEVSSKSIDKTILGSLTFIEMYATLNRPLVHGWSVEPDKETISRSEVDQPETENFRAEDLHDYPPRIVCRFFPDENAPKKTICTISLSGLLPQAKFHLELKAPTPKGVVDTTKLQEATEGLRITVSEMTTSQLGSTVESVISLMETMTTALQSSSLRDLAAHTDSIRAEIASVVVVTRRVVDECSIRSISENIVAGLSKVETLSHQLYLVAKVKLKHCQNQSEETAALVDLVENGANLLRSVDSLLKDIHTLSGFSGNAGYNVLVRCSEKIVESLSQEPKAIAVRLLSVGLITERVLQETNQLNEINADKANRLFTALLGVVKHHPHKYHEFFSTLKLNPLHTDLIRELDSK
ncbi:uncharacterized protein LOC135336766 isoform X2 [Halichondria panicea]|uniref:uncharacterized protein LOC135336766 isoform X2 n=1 Tax=Halichondria panicea TaxID=6063 RepID=UPI00312B6803